MFVCKSRICNVFFSQPLFRLFVLFVCLFICASFISNLYFSCFAPVFAIYQFCLHFSLLNIIKINKMKCKHFRTFNPSYVLRIDFVFIACFDRFIVWNMSINIMSSMKLNKWVLLNDLVLFQIKSIPKEF